MCGLKALDNSHSTKEAQPHKSRFLLTHDITLSMASTRVDSSNPPPRTDITSRATVSRVMASLLWRRQESGHGLLGRFCLYHLSTRPLSISRWMLAGYNRLSYTYEINSPIQQNCHFGIQTVFPATSVAGMIRGMIRGKIRGMIWAFSQ